MTGSTLAAILIPPSGTICLAAWLALVFYAGRDHPHGSDATRRPAAKALARPRWLTGARQTPAQPIGARGDDSGPFRQRRRLAIPGPGTTIAAAGPPQSSRPRPREEIMHPMFVKLCLQTAADDPLADEQEKL